jgi:hypothetical protein
MSAERDPLLSDAYLARFTGIVTDLFCVFDAGGIIDHASFGEPTPAGHRHRTVFRRRLRSRLP